MGREHLLAVGVEAAGLEAEVLLRHALQVSRTDLYRAWEAPVEAAQWERYRALLEARAQGRPVPYLTGRREFMGLELAVDERVLIPRPETEVLVEALLHVLADHPAPRVLDVGTGSGAIALALAHFLPCARVLATDVSAAALEVAAANARRLGLADRVAFARVDLLGAIGPAERARFDAVASNPPYVDPDLARHLPREIADYEPRLAVVDPGGGTTFHRRLAEEAPHVLRPGGWLAVEVAAGQAPAVIELFAQTGGYQEIRTVRDLLGIERVVIARRANNP
ncbi:MAG: peptide chain release factor N(5)-glutamine methyltransferase [Armatimonadota bacterium]|nr:peptide chain release factor N(5)-glutamine methyltransferase [Armatimonadota bacterium]